MSNSLAMLVVYATFAVSEIIHEQVVNLNSRSFSRFSHSHVFNSVGALNKHFLVPYIHTTKLAWRKQPVFYSYTSWKPQVAFRGTKLRVTVDKDDYGISPAQVITPMRYLL
jgi:hypothetical protein